MKTTKTMKTLGHTITLSIAALLVLGSLSTNARGFVSGGLTGPTGGESRGLLQLQGSVVCSACSLDEVPEAGRQSGKKFYELTHRTGQIVMDLEAVTEARRWSTSLGPRRFSVRAKDSVFQQLMDEENLFKNVEITGVLRNTRTLDMAAVTIHG